MQQLPDYLDKNLKLVSIGTNPSPYSIRTQTYYGNPKNRFWKALNLSGLVPELLEPGPASLEKMLTVYRMGFTDVVKPPTPGVADLKAADYRQWAPVLKEKLLKYQPEVCWFHGKVAYKNYLKYTGDADDNIDWGLQPNHIGLSCVFVTPNPSPANAAYSLDDLEVWYKKVKRLLEK